MNALLLTQLREAFSFNTDEEASDWLSDLKSASADSERITSGMRAFLSAVEATYTHHEQETNLHNTRPTTDEKETANARPPAQANIERQLNVVDTLRDSVNTLLRVQGKPVINDEFANISQLSDLELTLVSESRLLEKELLIQREAMDKHGIVATIDIFGKILTANYTCCHLSEYTREELIGESVGIFNVSNVSQRQRIKILKSLFKGHNWHGELHTTSKYGKPWYVSSTIVPVFNEDQRVEKLIVICTDISKQKHLEKRLAARKQFYQSITDSIGEGVYSVDEDGKTQFLNPEASRLLGWEFSELQAKPFHDAVHYQTESGALQTRHTYAINLRIGNGEIYSSDADYFTDKRGRLFPISLVAVPLKDPQGNPKGHVGVFKDISNQKATERRLHIAYEEAAKASKAKSDFLATMSHEIRTPMNAIIGLTHLALDTDSKSQKQTYMEKVQGSATSLLVLINSILDFSKVEAEQVSVNEEHFNLGDIINKLAQVFQHKTRSKQLHFLFDMHIDTNLECTGDSDKIYQVLVNLVGNAIKFTDKGYVKITVKHKDDALVFCVSDTGIGISDENKTKLFDAFVQADASISREYGGTGLGLAISKRLVELMGGRLTLSSRLTKGSEFCFTLPGLLNSPYLPPTYSLTVSTPLLCICNCNQMQAVANVLTHYLTQLTLPYRFVDVSNSALPEASDKSLVLLSADQKAWDRFLNHVKLGEYASLNVSIIITPLEREEARRRIGDSLPDNIDIIELPFTQRHLINALTPKLNSGSPHKADELENRKWVARRLNKKRVLIVDDDSISLEIAQQILLDAGLHVTAVTSGERAIEECKETEFDAILLDCMLPNMSGFDVAEHLIHNLSSQTPIIALSADGTKENKARAMRVGMCAHLLKPATPKEILHTIDIHVHRGYTQVPDIKTNHPFLTKIYQFYKTYSSADVLNSLINLMTKEGDYQDLLDSLANDADDIGARTLKEALIAIPNKGDANFARAISAISLALDCTLRLIAHTLCTSEKTPVHEPSPSIPLNELLTVIDSLKAYDADAINLLYHLYNTYSDSHYAHVLNNAKNLVSIYDYDGALEALQTIQEALQYD